MPAPARPARLLGERDLPPLAELARARAAIAGYVPPTPAQAAERERVLAFVDAHPDALLRSCAPGHLTASALLLDAAGERCLLTHHRKLGRWLQLGGHCDGDASLAGVALRECAEESGIAGLLVDPRPLDLDVHVIPARPGEPEHLHLDTRFVVWAPPGAVARASAESHEVAWLPLDRAAALGDESVARLVRRALA